MCIAARGILWTVWKIWHFQRLDATIREPILTQDGEVQKEEAHVSVRTMILCYFMAPARPLLVFMAI